MTATGISPDEHDEGIWKMRALMVAAGHGLRAAGRAAKRVFTLFQDDKLLAETYPEHYRPTGEQSATQGSVTMSLTSLGQG